MGQRVGCGVRCRAQAGAAWVGSGPGVNGGYAAYPGTQSRRDRALPIGDVEAHVVDGRLCEIEQPAQIGGTITVLCPRGRAVPRPHVRLPH